MKKFKLAGFVFPLAFAINQAMCVGFIEYSDIGVEDPPESSHARPNSIGIKDIVNEHVLLEEENNIKGINLAANVLSSKGIQFLVNTIINPDYGSRFKNFHYLNLLANPVGIEVLDVCTPLLKRGTFKFLDLCETDALESANFFQILEEKYGDFSHKVIFIPQRYLRQFRRTSQIKNKEKIYNSHLQYYKLKIWE